jgi:pyridoxine kinase
MFTAGRHNNPKLLRSRVSAGSPTLHSFILTLLRRLLTGIAINSVQNLQRALKILHEERHVPDVVISSLPLSTAFTQSLPPSIAVPREPADNIYNGETLLCVCSSSNTIGNPNIYAKAFPRIRGYFAGVGDIFSALVLAHYSAAPVTSTKASPALPRAVSLALITTASVILRTRHYYVSLPPSETPDTDDELDNKDPERRVKRMRARELRLIQSMDAIRAPNAEGSDMKEWSGFWEVD